MLPGIRVLSASLRAALGEIEGVSPEALERIEFISHPRTDCPPQDEERHAVYNRLVLLTLAETALARQQRASESKARRAS